MKIQAFTVKHVQLDGHIEYMGTDRVAYQPQYNGQPDQVFVGTEDGGVNPITSGSVYIMNAAGKTIDAYHFGSVEPISA